MYKYLQEISTKGMLWGGQKETDDQILVLTKMLLHLHSNVTPCYL